jgi:hypothetical protein
MTKTAKQELVIQIDQLQSILLDYKKTQANLPEEMNTQALADTIKQIEREISQLQIKLEVMVALALLYPYDRGWASPARVEKLSA